MLHPILLPLSKANTLRREASSIFSDPAGLEPATASFA
jgi:hypothetical protein